MAERAQPPRGGSSRGESCGDSRTTGSPHGEGGSGRQAGAGGSSPPPSCSVGWVLGPAGPRELSQSHAGTAGVWGLVRARQPAQERLSHGLQPRCGSAHPPSHTGSTPKPRGRGSLPPTAPRGCGTPNQQPQRRARVSLPHPAPPGVVGPPTMGFVGLFRAPDKGPEQPCEVSFLSLPQGARHNGRGGRDSPGPSPPSSPFPPQTPKDKIVGLSSEASSEAGCKEGFSSWDRRSPAHPLLKNPKIFQLAGLKTQKKQPQRHGHREQHGTDPKAATTRCPESTPRAPFGAGPLGIPFGAVPKSREEAEGTLAGQNQLMAGGSATAPGAARTHPAPQSRGETAGSEEGGKKPRKERPPRAVSPLLSSLCRVQLV